MKPKKNPKKDLNRNRSVYFLTGLALVMLLTFIALEWKTYETNYPQYISMDVDDDLTEEVPVFQLKTPPPPPPPVAPTIIDVVPDDPEIDETPIAVTEPFPDTPIAIDSVVVEEPEEDIAIPFSVIESVPVFPGCENETDKRACFQTMMLKHIRNTFRYPEIAQEMNIQGKVYMNFVIQKNGSIGEIRILRSPDKNLGEEATRIIGKLPKMTPGKQSGTPVKVPFSIPITFKLQ
ncbi:energy transducer TonB [Maribacter algicola]|uniref:Energy transducer TonB n=1 Tax=Meishania litoralis TaxID=3434685 RepID=A0ACC7LRF1_9FLAO